MSNLASLAGLFREKNSEIQRLLARIAELETECQQHIDNGIGALRLQREIETTWINFEDQPPPTDRRIEMQFASGVVCSGRYRAGQLGEGTLQGQVGWRCDCCGRFATPVKWRHLTT